MEDINEIIYIYTKYRHEYFAPIEIHAQFSSMRKPFDKKSQL